MPPRPDFHLTDLTISFHEILNRATSTKLDEQQLQPSTGEVLSQSIGGAANSLPNESVGTTPKKANPELLPVPVKKKKLPSFRDAIRAAFRDSAAAFRNSAAALRNSAAAKSRPNESAGTAPNKANSESVKKKKLPSLCDSAAANSRLNESAGTATNVANSESVKKKKLPFFRIALRDSAVTLRDSAVTLRDSVASIQIVRPGNKPKKKWYPIVMATQETLPDYEYATEFQDHRYLTGLVTNL